jgi:hypothetical protein
MNTTDKTELLRLLAIAEQEAVAAVNAQMPADSVPDRIAIPILNRLESEQAEIERAFASVLPYVL